MKWTQEKLEALYQQVNDKANTDSAFRQRVQADPKAAIEEVAGCALPEDFRLKFIERDGGYAKTYIVPDFAVGEMDMSELRAVAGGTGEAVPALSQRDEKPSVDVSAVLIVSICGAAASINPCPVDVCGMNACGGDACGEAACPGQGCGAKACGAHSGIGDLPCGAECCLADSYPGATCGGQTDSF